MKIKSINLITFRNYNNADFNFKDNNLILGENGTGKTSILEAIDIIASTRSSIARGINKCIKNNHKGFIITVILETGDSEKKIVFRQEKNAKRIVKIDDNLIEKSSQLLGVLNAVIFLPGDIEIIKGSPQLRRKYLDILISQIEKDYFETLKNYNLVLKHRNTTLKLIKEQNKERSLISIWDKQLIELGGKIRAIRERYIRKIEQYTAELYQKIGFNEEIKFIYKTDLSGTFEQDLKLLKDSLTDDIINGYTCLGIHRDDIKIKSGGLELAEYSSQGQQRLFSVCLKIAEARIKKEILQDPPILLIDDVLLELDLKRFNNLLREILTDSQKLFTVTDTNRFAPDVLEKMQIIEITKS